MNGHRQAAIALHSLAEEDRKLVLASLPPADQVVLRDFLSELTELGFDAGQLDEPARAPAGGAMPADAAARVRAASAPTMLAVLEREPASLVAAVLEIEAWPWRAELLALCAPERRTLIAGRAVPGAPARQRALLEGVAARVAEREPYNPVVAAPSALARLLGGARAWMR